MAHAIFRLRPHWTGVGSGLVLVLSRHAGRTPSLQRRGTPPDRGLSRHPTIRYPEGPVAHPSSQPLALDAFAHVFLLRIPHRYLSRLVTQVSERAPRF